MLKSIMSALGAPTEFKCNICNGEMKKLHFTEEGWMGSAFVIHKEGTTTSKIIRTDSYRCKVCGHLESFLLEEPKV